MKRKWKPYATYFGVANQTTLFAEGKTKREATKKLRYAFLQIGIHTRPDGLTDTLVVGRD